MFRDLGLGVLGFRVFFTAPFFASQSKWHFKVGVFVIESCDSLALPTCHRHAHQWPGVGRVELKSCLGPTCASCSILVDMPAWYR